MVLPIIRFPDKRLRIKAKPVAVVDEAVSSLVDDMFETMYVKDGIGLAATQVDCHRQIIVMNVPEEQHYQELKENRGKNLEKLLDISNQQNNPLCFINPVLIKAQGSVTYQEGCLSVPDFQADVSRYETVTVEALNQKGEKFSLEASGLLAICIQHEIDHLKGKLFIDYLSKIKQQRLKAKYAKLFP